jgi:hypothetical protein
VPGGSLRMPAAGRCLEGPVPGENGGLGVGFPELALGTNVSQLLDSVAGVLGLTNHLKRGQK